MRKINECFRNLVSASGKRRQTTTKRKQKLENKNKTDKEEASFLKFL